MKANEGLYRNIQWIPTGYANLDAILGGGVPLRKITEISGKFSVGKSTLALSMIAEAQKMKLDCLWFDAEFSYDEQYAESLGVNNKKLDLIQEHFAEDGLDQVEEWVTDHKKGLVVLDSIGGLLPRAEAEKNSGDKVIGAQAKLISTFCRKIVPWLAINNVALVAINHDFTDLMSGRLMTSGGAKLGYHKSIWLRLTQASKQVKQGDVQVGEIIKAEIRKNKLAPTMKQTCEMMMIFGQGFNKENDLLQEALDKNILRKEGQSYFFGEEKIARGMAALRDAFKDEGLQSKVHEALTAA